MARVVVWAKADPINPRPKDYSNSFYLPGDVVRVVEDGVYLGKDIEQGYPSEFSKETWWKIVEIPGMPANDASIQKLLFRDPGNTDIPFVTDLGENTPKRQSNLDISSFDLKAVGVAEVASVADIADLTQDKPLAESSVVIG